jgi:hypothetical protein
LTFRHIKLTFFIMQARRGLSVLFLAVPALLAQQPSQNVGKDGSSPAVEPYTAHLTITRNRAIPGRSSADAISTVVLARDRQGRIYEKTEHGSFIVQDPSTLQTLTWDSKSRVATLGHWPYWSGRKGCWADEHGQHQSSFPSEEDWHKIPASPGQGELEVIGSIAEGSKRIKMRFVSENLGHKKMLGLNAYGMRWTMTPLESGGPPSLSETTTELWKSSELDLKLLEVTSGPKFGSRREQLSDLFRGNPDPAFFKPPQDYKLETIEYHQVPCGQH